MLVGRRIDIPAKTNEVFQDNVKQNDGLYGLVSYLEQQDQPVSIQAIFEQNFDIKQKIRLYLRMLILGQYVSRSRNLYQLNDISIVNHLFFYPIFAPVGLKIYRAIIENGMLNLSDLKRITNISYTTIQNDVELLTYFGILNTSLDGTKKYVFITELGYEFRDILGKMFNF